MKVKSIFKKLVSAAKVDYGVKIHKKSTKVNKFKKRTDAERLARKVKAGALVAKRKGGNVKKTVKSVWG